MVVKPDRRRGLPSVEILLREPVLAPLAGLVSRALLVEAARAELGRVREALRTHSSAMPAAGELAGRIARRARAEARPRLRRVLNATGIVLHTNLGRAPLARPAVAALAEVARGYSSLELDLSTGRRGSRGEGAEIWLRRLTGAPAAAVVNNGAAAIFLTLSALAGGRGVLVSRGELVEIGGSFRVPDILAKSGARLIEVGTTNRTHLRDYERGLARENQVAAILRVHPSNFRIAGFTARPELRALAALARRKRVLLIEDLGSGALTDLARLGIPPEPTVAESLAAGADVVTCSGDKLLGGSQAGLILGRRVPLEKVRRDPLARALRADKLALTALEATLPLYDDPERAATEVPVLAMMREGEAALRDRAAVLAARLAKQWPSAAAEVVRSEAEAGGGSLPGVRLASWAVAFEIPGLAAQELERRARAGDPPVIGTIRGGRFRMDVRTLAHGDLDEVVHSLTGSLGDSPDRAAPRV